MNGPWDPWPPPTRAIVDDAYEAAGYDKVAFFSIIGQKTNWTRQPFTRSAVKVVNSPCAHAASVSGFGLCFVGDSIAREAAAQASVMLHDQPQACHGTNLSRSSSCSAATRTIARQSGRCVHYIMAMKVAPWTLEQDAFISRNCTAVFLGGMSTHWLLRNNSLFGPWTTQFGVNHDPYDPVSSHAAYFRAVLSNGSAYAQRHRTPVILMGTGPMDERTFISRPEQSGCVPNKACAHVPFKAVS